MIRILPCLWMLASITIVPLFSQDFDWSPSDVLHTEYLANATFSKDNSKVVWSKKRGLAKEDKFVSDLYITYLDRQEDDDSTFLTVRLTYADESDHSAIFSRDSKKIYFLSSRDKGKKLWRLHLSGGEAEAVHEFKHGVSNLGWLNDSTVLYISNEGKTLYEKQLEDKKDNTVVVEDTTLWKASRLYSFNLRSKQSKRITDNTKPLGGYAVSHDGRWIVYTMQMSRHYASDAQPDPQYFLVDMQQKTTMRILTELQFPASGFTFRPDNQGFYFASDTASDPIWNGAGISQLYYYDLDGKVYEKKDLEWDLGLARRYFVGRKGVYITLANKAHFKLAYYDHEDWSRKDVELGDQNNHVLVSALSEEGDKVLYHYSTASTLPQYFVSNSDAGDLTPGRLLLPLNSKLKNHWKAKTEVVTWRGFQEEEVTGLLFYPKDYDSTRTYPLMLSIHGGPAGADVDMWTDRWSTYPHLLSERGVFVLKPNYHGSSNHGLAFVESIKGNYYEPEMADIMSAIDTLKRQGKIDKDKMGVMGWSNGAIIATMMSVRYPDLFKVVCAGAGDVNWTSDYGTCRFGVSFDQSYFGGAPWDDVGGKIYNEKYILKSPFFELEKVKTPTIIFHGSEDRAVPRDQSWEYYRALQQAGNTAVRFLWFPGQPHGLRKITHQERKMKEELAWINTYLFEKKSDSNTAYKQDGPLASLIKRQALKSQDGRLGDSVQEKLVPEVQSLEGGAKAIGILEVTNGQFAAFDPNHTYVASHINHPAMVNKSQALAYVRWLAGITGKEYRLPNAKEAIELHKLAHKHGASENTINDWAGYEITIDEVSVLRAKIKDLASGVLLKPVGLYKAVKYHGVDLFDVGGNVAEHCESGTYGYSAYDFVDPHHDAPTKSSHVGFRVVCDLTRIMH